MRAIRFGNLFRSLDFTGHFQFHTYHRLHFQQEIAGVFDTPFHVRHFEFAGSPPAISGELGMNQRGEVMVRAMNRKNTVELYVRCPSLAYLALHLSRTEDHLGISWRLQDLFVHARVPGMITTFAAGGSDDNFSASLPGFRIEM